MVVWGMELDWGSNCKRVKKSNFENKSEQMTESNQIALVTGATAGIGREITAGLIDKGFLVVAVGRRAEAMEEMMNEIFISSPTRPSLSLRKIRIPLLIALGLGLGFGLVGGGVSLVVLLPGVKIPPLNIRILVWLLIVLS